MLLFLGFRQNVSRETFCFLFFQLLIAKYILIYPKYDDTMGKRSESRCKLACKWIFDTHIIKCKTVQKIFSELCVNWSQCLKIEFYE